MTFNEKNLVENYIIQKLEAKGWKFISAENLERESYEEPLLVPSLVKNLKIINQESGIGDDEINKVLNLLRLAGSGVEGAKTILNYYKFGIPVKFEKEKIIKYIQLFNFDEINNNELVITRQAYYHGRDFIRPDIILYVNGIPLVNIECKNPVNISESWYTAYKQIIDYINIVPELYKYIQIGIAAESLVRYFPIITWKNETSAFGWRSEQIGNKEEHNLEEDAVNSMTEMLAPEILLDIIRSFLFFRVERGESGKVITRYMQFRAANKIANRVLENLAGEEEKNKGLVWHWQGSGKTFTMIFAANKLYFSEELKNPTIFFIVDRKELAEQLSDEFNFLDIVKPEVIGSVFELKRILKHDDYRGKRGIFITLIHKFKPEELRALQKEIEMISELKETIMNRKNVIAFVDEGHRTQYGLLAAQMKDIFKSAFFFAFTGTPISKKGRDTYIEFSYPPEEIYLDKYFITDSIKDGYTVKIVYQPRLTEEVHLKKDMLEAFLNSELEELPEEIREEVEDQVKEKLNTIKLILENPKRINLIAKDIAEHFKENVDGKFKAIVVAGSRKACVIYKNMIDKYLPDDYSEIVMTYERKDEQAFLEKVAEVQARFGTKDTDDINKKIINDFKEKDDPKILIVTDMLLTGFDAPKLQVMYLDKLLKEHRLLQAIARTNRPYKGLKEAGIIIDYVGVLKEIKKALEIYNEEDIKHALLSLDNVREEFKNLICEILEIFVKVPRSYDRESLLKAIEILTTETEREKSFIEKYKNIRKIFEILGANEIKIEYLEDYKWITAVYTYYMKVVIQKPPIESYVEQYYDKTVKFIHQSTELKKLETGLPEVSFDEKYLQTLEEKVKSKKEKAANILFTLNRLVLVEQHKNPIYESITDKVQRLLKNWKEKTQNYENIYLDGIEIIKEIERLSERQRSLNLSKLEYSILLVLENEFGKDEKSKFQENELLSEVKSISEMLQNYMFPDWYNQPTEEKNVEKEVRKFVRGLKRKYGITLEEMDELFVKLIERIKNYGTI